MMDPVSIRRALPLSEHEIVASWRRLGLGFNIEPVSVPVEVEPLLVASLPVFAGNSRLFIMVASWLRLHADLLDERALAKAYSGVASRDDQARLALLLELGLPESQRQRFEPLIASIAPASSAQPFFSTLDGAERLKERASRRSSELGKKWNLWIEEFEFKFDALCNREWILEQNPHLQRKPKH